MSKVNVKVNLSKVNLQALKDSLHSKAQELIVDTINEATDVADGLISQAQAWGDNTDVDTVVDVKDLEANLTMNGSQCLFVEYGAGDLTLFPYFPGEWSEQHGQQYSKHGCWYHKVNGETIRFTSIPPYRPIYNATQSAIDYIDDHAKEVFTQ